MTFELYRLLLTAMLAFPVLCLLGHGVLRLFAPKGATTPHHTHGAMLFGMLIGIGASAGIGYLIPLISLHAG